MGTLASEPLFRHVLTPANLQHYSWIGDAVLLLYARLRIVRETGGVDDAKCVRMTSNRFLSSLGEPTRVEAEIGRVYSYEGFDAAAAWIEKHLVPLFERQEEKRARLSAGRKTASKKSRSRVKG